MHVPRGSVRIGCQVVLQEHLELPQHHLQKVGRYGPSASVDIDHVDRHRLGLCRRQVVDDRMEGRVIGHAAVPVGPAVDHRPGKTSRKAAAGQHMLHSEVHGRVLRPGELLLREKVAEVNGLAVFDVARRHEHPHVVRITHLIPVQALQRLPERRIVGRVCPGQKPPVVQPRPVHVRDCHGPHVLDRADRGRYQNVRGLEAIPHSFELVRRVGLRCGERHRIRRARRSPCDNCALHAAVVKALDRASLVSAKSATALEHEPDLRLLRTARTAPFR